MRNTETDLPRLGEGGGRGGEVTELQLLDGGVRVELGLRLKVGIEFCGNLSFYFLAINVTHFTFKSF